MTWFPSNGNVLIRCSGYDPHSHSLNLPDPTTLNSHEHQKNRLKTLPSMGDPAVADGQQPPPPPPDRPPRENDRDAGDGTNNNELARFARLIRSKHNPPLNVAAVDKDGNCLFCVVLLQVYGNASAHTKVRRRCLDYMEAEAEHYRDFVAGSAPPPPKTMTTTMRDTTMGQRGARQQWGGVRQRWGANPTRATTRGRGGGGNGGWGGGQAMVGGSATLVMHMNWTFLSDRSVAIMY